MALITVLQIGTLVQTQEGYIIFTTRLKPYFDIRVFIFYVCEGSCQSIANQLNMQKNYGIYIFD